MEERMTFPVAVLALSMKDITQHVIRKIRILCGCLRASCNKVAVVGTSDVCVVPVESPQATVIRGFLHRLSPTTATDYRKIDNHECHESHECKTPVSMSFVKIVAFVVVPGLHKTE